MLEHLPLDRERSYCVRAAGARKDNSYCIRAVGTRQHNSYILRAAGARKDNSYIISAVGARTGTTVTVLEQLVLEQMDWDHQQVTGTYAKVSIATTIICN
ncbi:hypothetical protein BSK60_20615 [Paenibacillus odorifer]|nr:hypothetical protein BSK60_20615 [Paenibacillus odorifer]